MDSILKMSTEERHTLSAQWQFGQGCFCSGGSLAGRKDSLEGWGGLGNFGESTRSLDICVMQTPERAPRGHTWPLAVFYHKHTLFFPNYDPKHAEKYSGHGQFVQKPKCLWNNTVLRTEGQGKQNPTLCCKSTALLNAGEIPLLAGHLTQLWWKCICGTLSVKKSHPTRPRRSRASPQL